MRTIKLALYLFLLALCGCAPANVSPGMTFLVGLNGYQTEMERLEARPERWFDRQRAGDALKKTYVLTMGGSREFNRLVDLDVKRREFLITLRDSAVKPDRAKEMKEELVAININVDDLKQAVRTQVANTELKLLPTAATARNHRHRRPVAYRHRFVFLHDYHRRVRILAPRRSVPMSSVIWVALSPR